MVALISSTVIRRSRANGSRTGMTCKHQPGLCYLDLLSRLLVMLVVKIIPIHTKYYKILLWCLWVGYIGFIPFLFYCPLAVILRMALVFIMKQRTADCITWFGIKCSSFTGVNRGTSKRSACNSIGDTNAPSVNYSNGLLERTAHGYHYVTPLQPNQFPMSE